ncbi:TVP38/TMEM64 family protein [Bellilinea sp.]|jgi:membrane protein DedA with SNARE-associated domain|uniref:DedA family protein n=1 Tax=Bellilinea caldifistulae TaxID=360411 RepID=A0A7C4Q153_9CHLR|nr:VTT domain-containing protein [Bellilinea sp.]
MNKETRLKIARILALVFVVGLTIFLYINREKVRELESFGYPGIFLVSLLANATLILPLPGVLFTSAMGAVFNPFWVAVAAGSGAALGELSGYLAGFSGQGIVEKTEWSEKFERWMRKYGPITILVLSFVPNPIFDVAGITAGILKMPLWQFLLFSWIGKVLKMLIFSYGGSFILNLFPF